MRMRDRAMLNFNCSCRIRRLFSLLITLFLCFLNSGTAQAYKPGDTVVMESRLMGWDVGYRSTTPSICNTGGYAGRQVYLRAPGNCDLAILKWPSGEAIGTTSLHVEAYKLQTISWNLWSYGGEVYKSGKLGAQASSGLPVSFSSQTTSVCSVTGNNVFWHQVGLCTIKASVGGNSIYAPTSVTRSHQVVGAPANITWTQSLSGSVGSTVTLTASSSSRLAVSYVSSTNNICTVNGTTLNLIAVGTCTVTASQSGNAYYNAATPVTREISVISDTPITQSITWPQPLAGSVGAEVTLTASSSSGLVVSYASGTPGICSVNGAALYLIAVGTCTVTASQNGDANYSAAAPVSKRFRITRGSQSIKWTQTLGGSVGEAGTLTASSSSGLVVSYASSTPEICGVSGATLYLIEVGTCKIRVSQPGDVNYKRATPIIKSFSVTAEAQVRTTYQKFPSNGMRWEQVRSAAVSLSTLTSQCYLANITSQAELDYIEANVAGVAGSDSIAIGGRRSGNNSNTWYWADGPEAGVIFWKDGVAIGDNFPGWDPQHRTETWTNALYTGIHFHYRPYVTGNYGDALYYLVECTTQGNISYEKIAANGMNWEQARSAALRLSTSSKKCYLANITSQVELDFVEANVAGVAGSDSIAIGGRRSGNNSNTWYWADGPEAGVIFWKDGVAVGDNFPGWDPQNRMEKWDGSLYSAINSYRRHYTSGSTSNISAYLVECQSNALSRNMR